MMGPPRAPLRLARPLLTSKVMRFVAAIILFAHGLAHIPGFVAPWRLSTKFPYKTTIFAGHLDVGRFGARVVGGLWLLMAINFAIVAWAAKQGAAWWPLGALEAAVGSLLLCLVDLPEAGIGVAVDVVLIAVIFAWRAGLGLLRLS